MSDPRRIDTSGRKLVDNASAAGGNHVKGILADGMYDCNNNFRYLSSNHIKPGIKTRSKSKVRPTNCQARNVCNETTDNRKKVEAQSEL